MECEYLCVSSESSSVDYAVKYIKDLADLVTQKTHQRNSHQDPKYLRAALFLKVSVTEDSSSGNVDLACQLPECVDGVHIASRLSGTYDLDSNEFHSGQSMKTDTDLNTDVSQSHLGGSKVLPITLRATESWKSTNQNPTSSRSSPLLIFVSGGIMSGRDALVAATHGANGYMLRSAFVMDGLLCARRVKHQLSKALTSSSFYDLSSAVSSSKRNT